MKIQFTNTADTCLPTYYLSLRFMLRSLPLIFNVNNEFSIGNGSGYGRQVLTSATGEYLERYHFYNEVKTDCYGMISDLPEKLQRSALTAIQQITTEGLQPEMHNFACSRVENIFSNNEVYMPTALISLAMHAHVDRKFIPFIDSCGQAVHRTAMESRAAALLEFLERQTLISSWQSEMYKYRIAICKLADMLPECRSLSNMLMQNGSLYLFDLSNHFAVYSVLAIYFAHNPNDSVQYAVGMAANLTPTTAINNALLELWQTYSYIYINTTISAVSNGRYRYLNDLLLYNNQATRDILPFELDYQADQISLKEYLALPELPLPQTLSSIQTISDQVYLYQRIGNFNGQSLYFSKILSTDFYLHMALNMPLNHQNSYSKLSQILPNNNKQAIPFP